MSYFQSLGAAPKEGDVMQRGNTLYVFQGGRWRRKRAGEDVTGADVYKRPVSAPCKEGKVRRDGRTGVRQVCKEGQWVDEGQALRTTRKDMSDEDKLKAGLLNCKAAGVPPEYLDACAAEFAKRHKPGKPAADTLQSVVTDLQKAAEEGKLPAATPEQPLPPTTPIPRAGLFGIPLTYLLIGGAALVGGIVIIRRRKKS